MAEPSRSQVVAAPDHSSPPDQSESDDNSPGSTEFQLKSQLILLATLVATVTYAAGLNLPGGVWQDTQAGAHLAGDPILPETHHRQYLAFYYCNATAFATSLVACLLLLLLDATSKVWPTVLRAVMVLDLLGLMGAYAAGSCRDAFTTIYSAVLVSAVLGYITCIFFPYAFSWVRWRCNKKDEAGGKSGGGGSAHKREEEHKVLMLLATFAVTITYVAGLNPPGGFWCSTENGYLVSDPIMQDRARNRYQAFFVCNSTAFVASLLIVVLLLDKKLYKKVEAGGPTVRFLALYGLIVVALLGLVGAYASGSCREANHTIYVISLAAAVLAYIFLHVLIVNAIHKYGCGLLKAIGHFGSTWLKKISDQFTPSSGTPADEELEKHRSLILLLATLVVSITYQAGLDPPGGVWPDDQHKHKGGDPVLLTTHPTRYNVFFYSNSVAFVASLVVIIMVHSKFLLRRHTLHAVMILDLFGLITAYAAGSCRDLSTSIYVIALAGVVLVYVVIHIIFFTLDDQTDNNPKDVYNKTLDARRETLLLLAILAATLTYQAGLTPPGGFWPADDKLGHRAGFPVLLDNYRRRYIAFFYCNAASFMASVTLIVLLVNPTLYKPGIQCYALYVCMAMGMFGLMGAYAAGSSRHLQTSIYVLTLVAAVFTFVTMQVVFFLVSTYQKDGSSKKVGDNNTSLDPETPVIVTGASRQGSSSNSVSSEITTRDIGNGTAAAGQGGPWEVTPPDLSDKEKREKDLREYLMLLGVLAASVTYQSGLKPPGGLWQDTSLQHTAGDSILRDVDRRRYNAFFYSNSASFMASIVVVVLLLPEILHSSKVDLGTMHTAILLDMLGLLGAYAAGSTREWEMTRYVIALVAPVLIFIAAYAVMAFFRKKPAEKTLA